jgi:WD40 repeat protein
VATRQEQPCTFQGTASDLESPSYPPQCLKFGLAPDGKCFATTRMRHGAGAILWDVAAGKERLKLDDQGEPAGFSPDGRLVAILNGQYTCLMNTRTGLEVRRLRGDSIRVICAAFSPDGKTLATAGDEKAVSLWEVVTAKQRHVLKGHHSGVRFVAFSPDGRQLASGGDDHTALL